MNNNEDLDKTVINEKIIDNELDKTLDAALAGEEHIEATIKVDSQEEDTTAANITLVANSDNSQTVTIRQSPFSYQQQMTFAADSIADESATVTVGNDTTLSSDREDATVAIGSDGVYEESLARTATDSDQDKTITDNSLAGDTEQTIIDAAHTGNEDKTIGDDGSISDSKTITDSRGGGTSVNVGGGTLSINVRPRSINNSLSEVVAGISQNNPGSFSDYELLEKLGEGGMGVVYSARQSSIDRSIALKMIKGDMATEEAKSKFLIEAVVTGDLDHPNIVPVHDLGIDDNGNIFYAMKQVGGIEWHKAIKEKTKEENIDILLRVCDAIAFSHARGIIHRDLKPENVMLGSFGEVLVMDWGLAVAVSDNAKAEAIGPHTGIAGTPAYLAPEMARTGAWKMLGVWSDIYLLGAILFEIVQGKRVHTGKNVRECLRNAANNVIVKPDHECEFTKIALKAMATNPADRYQSVKEFQHAIRECTTHFESIALSDQAAIDLTNAGKTKAYNDYSTAYFGYKKASDLWEGNAAAEDGEKAALIGHAYTALDNGDFDLGLSLILFDEPEFLELKDKLLAAKQERDKHLRRTKLMTQCVVALGIIILVVSVVAAIWIQRERGIAIEQREEAVKQEKIAVEQREEAKRQEKIAVEQREEAKRQEKIAVEQREEAKRQEKIAIEKGDEARRQAEIARQERAEAQRQEKIAVEQREEAKRQEKIAVEQKHIAQEQRNIAESEREEARRQEKIALTQKAKAEKQEQIALEQKQIAQEQRSIAEKEREEAQRQEQIALEQKVKAEEQEKIAVAQREEAKRQEQFALEQKAKAEEQEKIAVAQREEAKRQEQFALEQKAIAEEQEQIAIKEREEAKRQEKIALEQKAIAEAETERANKQTVIANKARVIAEEERAKAEKSEARALEAVDAMVKAQNQEELEKARRKAAELTAKETTEELQARDELKKNEWWIFDSVKAEEMQQTAAKEYHLPVEEKINLAEDVDMKFRLIPGGMFGMGSREDELGRSSEEYLHRVNITKPFYLAETELTLKQWIALTGKKADGEGDYPVWNLSYNEINDVIIPAVQKKLPQGWKVMLPSEAQWEWAARAGTNTPYPTGSGNDAAKEAGVTGAELLTSAKSVRKRKPNAWGLYDIVGNVAEWCDDSYMRDSYLSEEKIAVDPLVKSADNKHVVVRGGAWSNLPEHCRVAYRSYANKKSKYNFLGVRLLIVPELNK